MKFLVAVFVGICFYGLCNADSPPQPQQPFVGDWNFTNPGLGGKLCMKLQAGIRLDIVYDTNFQNSTTKTATIYSTDKVAVDEDNSHCENSTSDTNETLALKFNHDRTLMFYFTRDPSITKDSNKNRWQLYKIEFDFVYDNETFPDSAERDRDQNATLANTNTTLSGINTASDRSFSCSKTGAIDVTDRFKISFSNLRAQAFMTRDDFSTADHCQADQETTDLIPIIIGAALAALVIIVLIAYLIGRARANTPAYDNMK